MSPNGNVQLEYVAAGGNSHPSAADWATGLLAFGAGINVALWNPDNEKANYGVSTLLAGHTGTVNAVKIQRQAIHHQRRKRQHSPRVATNR
jgi:hypothetical protein